MSSLVELLDPQHSFEVEFVQDIMQQESDSFDCGMFFPVFVEFLSNENNIPLMIFEYGLNKAETGYVSENDDPTRSKSDYTPPTEDDPVNVE
ncbi:hypothetical protein H5410_063719 [Solanum commersonii]|uniref:Ubiquitin-like protease family profile domain-containing protein n=1 Tax=Solanum commersonii TaxID=4109 RepID=A0A9J5WE04_SOLCO|nr:hypothetical protein H5410_063719 [Solanum commersonii]